MSRLISDILNAPEPHFSHTLKMLEQKSGQSGHDLRLISDIVQHRKRALHELGLDEADTTPRELFYSLRYKAVSLNDALNSELNISRDETPEQVIAKILAFIDTLDTERDVWTIKSSIVKQLLKKQIPKKLLKTLGLRSIESVLKRTSPYELLSLAYQVEQPEWSTKMRASYKKLKPVDFQVTKSCIFVVDASRVAKLHKGGYTASQIVVPNYETGTVLVVTPPHRFQLDTLALTLTLLQMLYDMRVYSAYFRLISVKAGFGQKIHSALQHGLPGKMHNGEIGWHILQRHFNISPESFSHVEQPHLQHEDIKLKNPLSVLESTIPAVAFWVNSGHVFMVDDGKPVSLHLMDVVMNASNQLAYEDSVHASLRQHLWEELGLRYLVHDNVQTLFIEKVEN